MFGLRSAQARMAAAVVLLMLLFVAISVMAVWSARDHQSRLKSLEERAQAATALESARSNFYMETLALIGGTLIGDPLLEETAAGGRAGMLQDLAEARSALEAAGDTEAVLLLDDLTGAMEDLQGALDQLLPTVGAGGTTALISLFPLMTDTFEDTVARLDEMADGQRAAFAAEEDAASRGADNALWALVALASGAFLLAVIGAARLTVSVVGPLATLRATAAKIISGDLEARAATSGPEEVASLAHDFNEMTDALLAKTNEYVTTTNLTGDIIGKLDNDGRWTFLNDAACQFFEKSREQLLGTDSKACMHPEDIEPTAESIREARARKRLMTGVVNRFITPMGTRVVEWNGCPLFDQEGRYSGIQITGRDITERMQAEEALRTKDSAMGSSISAIALSDLEGNLTYVNFSFLRLWEYDDDQEVLGRPATGFWESEEKASEVIEALRDRGSWIGELVAVRRDGSAFDVQLSASMVTGEGGKPICMMGSFVDVSERKQMEQALEERERRYRLLAENASDVIWTTDMNLRFTYVSPSVARMRGYSAEEAIAQSMEEVLTPESFELVRKTLAEESAIEKLEHKDLSRSRTLELEQICRDGSTNWVEVKVTFLRDEDSRPVGILGVSRDITKRRKAERDRERLHAELELRAITDSLTALYDHAHFHRRLAEELDRSGRYNHGFAVVMMDVDAFKQFNESSGHQAGDKVLRLIADCIQSGLRRSDLAFRYGGDEFAAILPHADTSEAGAVISRINRRIARTLRQMDGGAAGRLRLSAGVACFPEDATTADELVRIADAALYSTKWVARARDIMAQKEDIQSLVSALVSRRAGVDSRAGQVALRPEALHEQHARIVSSVASSIAVALEDAGVPQVLEDPDLQILAIVGAAAEIKDRYIRGHPERTSEGVLALARKMGLSPERVRDVHIAGLLHDIGKVTVSEGILNKPGKLTRRESAAVREHPIVGATLVSQVRGFERVVPIIRHHHERFDGKGYPDGLAGEDIPLEARILSVVDVFDALTHQRSYRKALSREEAAGELQRRAGVHFDPAVVEAFLALVSERGDELAVPAQVASGGRQTAIVGVPGPEES